MLTHSLQKFISANQLDLIDFQALPVLYEDSTHQIYQLQCQQGAFYLKRLRKAAMGRFWQGMSLLFDFDLSQETANSQQKYEFLDGHTPLQLPRCLASSEDGILLSAIEGQPIEPPYSKQNIQDLAKHLSALHGITRSTFGSLMNPKLEAREWPQKIQDSLEQLSNQAGLEIELPKNLHCETFCPIMMDLRLDQFLQTEQQETYVLDLDAYVFADKRLEFVMLEYLLSKHELDVFCRHYQQTIPNLALVRAPYRDLLFLMNLLGETDRVKWLAHPIYFGEQPVQNA